MSTTINIEWENRIKSIDGVPVAPGTTIDPETGAVIPAPPEGGFKANSTAFVKWMVDVLGKWAAIPIAVWIFCVYLEPMIDATVKYIEQDTLHRKAETDKLAGDGTP